VRPDCLVFVSLETLASGCPLLPSLDLSLFRDLRLPVLFQEPWDFRLPLPDGPANHSLVSSGRAELSLRSVVVRGCVLTASRDPTGLAAAAVSPRSLSSSLQSLADCPGWDR